MVERKKKAIHVESLFYFISTNLRGLFLSFGFKNKSMIEFLFNF